MTDLYFDFLCPYAWRGVELANVLKAEGEAFRLRHFSLVQGNHPGNAAAKSAGDVTWWLSDQPAGEGPAHQQGSLGAFLAHTAAARQGEEASWAFALALFRRRHEQEQALDEAAIQGAAGDAGLDAAQFAADRQDDAGLRAALRRELSDAADLGVFGTPTFVLEDGAAAYYRFENLTRDPQTARAWWDLYRTVLNDEAGIATIKRAKNRPAKKA
ncbi:DsbA family protein [Deinococcus petrolearius]|uniref:DsbA family protein n=1 Tax=Deinococcus petrolearius TaxID=1751295 RepID=A0ABW1DIK6_9DEIO